VKLPVDEKKENKSSMKFEEQPGHHWREPDRVAEYLESSDRRERERAAVLSLMTRLINAEKDARLSILDIGSGHGPMAAACLDAFPNAHAIGLDISDAMMAEGSKRMARFGDRFRYMVGDFGEGRLPQNAVQTGPYDLVVSSRAIHHLPSELMKNLYADIYANLKPGGAFFNLDTASPENDFLADLFRSIRRTDESSRPSREANEIPHSVRFYHHRDATLARHIEWLKEAGFVAYECFWKRLGTALMGGWRGPLSAVQGATVQRSTGTSSP
jgi:ubiquinone/menaquinone biosynthesis C-methylase UbiE